MSNQDPYRTPHQQPYAGQGFGSGPGYPGPPPPPKKRTGLIIGAVVAALVVIGGLVVAGIVLLGDDDTKESSSEAKDEPSEEPTEEPTDEPDGGTVAGTNYTYSLPDEQWLDATADAAAAGTVVDSVAVWGEQLDGSRANVLVEAGSAEGTLAEQRDSWESNLAAGGSELERLPDVTVDGETAYAVQLEGTNSSGTEIVQTVYLTIHQEIVYSIGFSSQPADDEAEAGFDVIKNSWAWTS